MIKIIRAPDALPEKKEAWWSHSTPASILLDSPPQVQAWQKDFIEYLKQAEKELPREFHVISSHRLKWDPSWNEQTQPALTRDQATWEMDALAAAGTVAMYFDKDNRATDTFLHLGLWAPDTSEKLIVYCAADDPKRSMVNAVCEYYDIPLTDNKKHFFDMLKKRIIDKADHSW